MCRSKRFRCKRRCPEKDVPRSVIRAGNRLLCKKLLFVFDTNVNAINLHDHHMALRSVTKHFGKYCDASGEHCDEKNEEAVSASPFIDDAAGTITDHV